MRGHAYFLYGTSDLQVAGDGFLLIGDCGGTGVFARGGKVLLAIELGLRAAETILAAKGRYAEAQVAPYPQRLARRFGTGGDRLTGIAGPSTETRSFVRNYVLDRCRQRAGRLRGFRCGNSSSSQWNSNSRQKNRQGSSGAACCRRQASWPEGRSVDGRADR